MSSTILLSRFRKLRVTSIIRKVSSTSDKKPPTRTTEKSPSTRPRLGLEKLRSVVSKMKVANNDEFFAKNKRLGHSELFNYATNEKFDRNALQQRRLDLWDQLLEHELTSSSIQQPINGFEELIMLTERGLLWKYPIDNEQGLDAEKAVPFEDHVFLDQHLEDFPKSEYIRSFMSYVVAGLGRNHTISVDRKREIIAFFKGYFEEKRDAYKERGLEI